MRSTCSLPRLSRLLQPGNRVCLSVSSLWALSPRVLPANRCCTAPQQSVPKEIWSTRGAEIGLQSHMRDKKQPVTARATNTRDNQMTKWKCRDVTNRNQGNMPTSAPNSPTTASPGYHNTPEKQYFYLKSQLMMLMVSFQKDINNSLKEIQEKPGGGGACL